MDENAVESLEKVRKQFDTSPFPRIPLEHSPKGDTKLLYIHNLVTPYYTRNQRVIETEGKVILDAGCGTGYKSLILAEANPEAKIIGIDISEESVKMARKRLHYHGFENAEFHVLPIENLPNLGINFDHINCDEVLYLLPDPIAELKAMKSSLKPDGTIRANLHSLLQRTHYYRVQEVFRMMGLLDEIPGSFEIDLVRQTMAALKDRTLLKRNSWNPDIEKDDERILANHLLQGDKGYTMPEMFIALRAADLEFISMVPSWEWELMDLFKEPDNLPAFLGMSLPSLPIEECLHLYELLHPVHRLLDFWCGHPNQTQPFVPVVQWNQSDWQEAQVHLHPQVRRTPEFTQALVACVTDIRIFEIGEYLPFAKESNLMIDSTVAASILPLLSGSQSMKTLVERWKQVRPINPVNLQPISDEENFETVKQLLITLEGVGYILLERRSNNGSGNT